ncbi:2-dehydro-3-deoxy-D-gluconate 5-dehydrogenase KduD [Roseateles sp.]|uniref:2-dehydro-3-deoxy-D-gluconate 5-dehydrogenase KduD n=1 Tax=Roseateles sp. TaxID=1971397 RepID=UPI003BA63408
MVELFSIEGKTALVTGGTSGIGAAIAAAYVKAGAKVAVTEHTETAGADAVTRVREDGVLVVRADLAEPAGAQWVVDAVEKELGALDILVNCAGTIRRAPAEEFPESDWSQVMAVNLDAVWRLSQLAGAKMLKRGEGGKIINIASLLSFQGGIRVPSYTASKHAVVGLTKALANEWAARGVNVNAIAPGYISTANTQALREDEQRNRQILERIPAGRWGQASDLAGAAMFLAAPASSYIHGHVLVVDGGWLAR